MKIEIRNNLGYYDAKEVVLTKKRELSLEFVNLTYEGQAFLIATNKGLEQIVEIKDNRAKVKDLKSGTLKAYIEIREDDRAIDRIILDDLTITVLKGVFEAIPVIEKMKFEIEQLKVKVEDLTGVLSEVAEVVESLITREITE